MLWKQKHSGIIKHWYFSPAGHWIFDVVRLHVCFISELINIWYFSFNFKTKNPQAVLQSAILYNEQLYLGFHSLQPPLAFIHTDNPVLQILSSLRFNDTTSAYFFLTFSTTFDSSLLPSRFLTQGIMPPQGSELSFAFSSQFCRIHPFSSTIHRFISIFLHLFQHGHPATISLSVSSKNS